MNLTKIDLIKLTINSLTSNPLRSILSGLGVFMGVAAVTATLQVGEISKAVIAKQLEARDAPQVTIYSSWRSKNRKRLTLEDLDYLKKQLTNWQSISGLRWAGYPTVIYQKETTKSDTFAVSPDILETTGRKLLKGRTFSKKDYDQYRSVVIIDKMIEDKIFQNEDPVGKRIYLDNRPFFVVGVMETKLKYAEDEPEGELMIPLSLFSALTGRKDIHFLSIRPQKIEDLEKLQEWSIKLLTQKYLGAEFEAETNMNDIIEQQETLNMVSKALLAVGAIALLVGGVGIANITIASVIERTPEIGLRRAIGATQRDIMLQFILEGALLSLIAGIGAIAVVHGITIVVTDYFKLPYQFNNRTATMALSSAIIVGVGAGFFPALRASQLDPVKALKG